MTDVGRRSIRRAADWSVALSLLMTAAGFLAIGLPGLAGVAVDVLVGWLLLFRGVLHVLFAARAGTTGAIVREVVFGAVCGVLGAYLLAQPEAGVASLTVALAIYLVIEGILDFVLALELRPMRATRWLVFNGVVTLTLAGIICVTWPASTAWAIGTLVGVRMVVSGMTRLAVSLAVRQVA